MIVISKAGRLGVLLFILFSFHFSWSAKIRISSVSDLNFGTGVPGDPAKNIPPGTTENATNASFQIIGDANTSFTITLPITAAIDYKSGNNRDSIDISNFSSYPQNNGLLNGSGEQFIYIGATRAALKPSQLAGSYSGNFTVTVVY